MLLKDFLPNPAFIDYVQMYRIAHFVFDRDVDVPLKAYPPKPEVCLHFMLRDRFELIGAGDQDYRQPIVLAGQQTCLVNRYSGKDLLNLQIVFQPTGLFRLTGIPSYEMTNKYVDAESFFPKRIRSVYDQLQYANDYTEMLAIAEQFVGYLVGNVKKEASPLDAVGRHMMYNNGTVSLDWLAKESCLSIKQFRRKFNERTGVNPNTYSRIIRFTNAFNLKNRNPHTDWLRIALECDYYDYQHLAKEYKHFTGLSPNEFHLLEHSSPESRFGLLDDIYSSRCKTVLK